ncbi:MAG: hypothetical protein ACK5OP_15605 [Sphingobacteriales bacterium]
MRTTLLFLITFFLSVYTANGQVRRKDRSIMKDTLDGKLDFSRYMVDAKGFLPIPLVITEPALGSFGFVIAPVFLTPKKMYPRISVMWPRILQPDLECTLQMDPGHWAAQG